MGNPQSLNRYSYVGNSPIGFNDPTGHMQSCGVNGEDDCPDHDPSPLPSGGGNGGADAGAGGHHHHGGEADDDDPQYAPWENDPQASNWGTTPSGYSDNSWRVERARRVLDWLTNYLGHAPSELDIATFLLWKEGNTIVQGNTTQWDWAAIDIMARATRYRFKDGMTPDALSGFTAFFNPQSDGRFDKKDWKLLTRSAIPSYFVTKMKDVYSIKGDYVRRDAGSPVIYWWDANEGGANASYSTNTLDGDPPSPIPFYFGNYSQCQASNFVACP